LFVLVAIAFLSLRAAMGAETKPLPCFDEFQQIYEYDDGGKTWDAAGRKACNGAPKGKALMGGHLEVRQQGKDVYFREETFHWTMVVTDPARGCTGARQVHIYTTKVLRDGVYYELVEHEGKPPRRTERHRGGLYVPQAVKFPHDLNRAPFESLGHAVIAGHECERFRARVSDAVSSVNCLVRLAPQCESARYLLPLELTSPEAGMLRVEGRTTLLRTGERGRVFPSGAISPP
jgi:hypothetical protein